MSNIKLFESKHIRSVWDDEARRWLFAVVDVVAALSESQNPQVYWRVLKKRLLAEGNETVTNCNGLKMKANDYSDEWIEKPWAYTKDILALDCRR